MGVLCRLLLFVALILRGYFTFFLHKLWQMTKQVERRLWDLVESTEKSNAFCSWEFLFGFVDSDVIFAMGYNAMQMDEFVLPPFESTSILKNKDVIRLV